MPPHSLDWPPHGFGLTPATHGPVGDHRFAHDVQLEPDLGVGLWGGFVLVVFAGAQVGVLNGPGGAGFPVWASARQRALSL